ncbi:MAG: hypothetical protein ACP5N7_03540 [Candidatus Pacearchaeota archaeon]
MRPRLKDALRLPARTVVKEWIQAHPGMTRKEAIEALAHLMGITAKHCARYVSSDKNIKPHRRNRMRMAIAAKNKTLPCSVNIRD